MTLAVPLQGIMCCKTEDVIFVIKKIGAGNCEVVFTADDSAGKNHYRQQK